VSLYAEIDPAGHPSKVAVMQGLGLGLDEKAIAAVKQWQYKPASSGSDQIQAAIVVEVPFRLDQPVPWRVGRAFFLFRFLLTHYHRDEPVKPVMSRYVIPEADGCTPDGSVVIQFRVDTAGHPQEVKVVKYGGPFARSLENTVRSWQFHPGLN